MDQSFNDKRIIDVNELRVTDVPIVGGKGANLGELTSSGFPVPNAFVLTTVSYDEFVKANKLMDKVAKALRGIDRSSDDSLVAASKKIRSLFDKSKIPSSLSKEIADRYKLLCGNKKTFVAVRSSATAEDLPDASFAGQQETYLNVGSLDDLYKKVIMCWSSLFTARAISYREAQGYAHEDVKLAVVVQKMVNSEFSGIMFTKNPNTGSDDIIIEGGYGLGEAFVGGEVTPDTYTINKSRMSIVNRRFSVQKWKYVRGPTGGAVKEDIPESLQNVQKIQDEFVQEIAEIGRQVEIHYEKPMDMEWCIEDGRVYLVQARPITTLNKIKEAPAAPAGEVEGGVVVLTGLGASPGMVSGKVCIYEEGMSLDTIKEGDVLVTKMTMPDMVPAMSRSVAIVTDEGGMTCHAAIISRELGTPCVVGTVEATSTLKNGETVTVDGSTGTVYRGEIKVKSESKSEDSHQAAAAVAVSVPVTGTKVMVNMSMPTKASDVAKLPCDGVGLMRSEFLFTNYVGEHPCAVLAEGRKDELINKLAEGIGKVARAFYPRPVTLRTSDFKTNEYRDMKGGAQYEPTEDNPMIGWRGCSRYVSESYREAFMCELLAIKKVRDEGMKNINIMLPFVRTIDEVKQITAMMESVGLRRGNDLKLYFMAEVPVNIFMADEFSEYCDWFSIGSNDLTQLTMGCDRDSDILGRMGYFDERNPGVKAAISHLIKTAHAHGKKVSICGQAPSVYPEFCEFLVEEGIDCISLNPDTFESTKRVIASAEQKVLLKAARKQLE